MKVETLKGKIDITTDPVPVWNWTGWDSQWVESLLTADEVRSHAAEFVAWHGENTVVTEIESGEHTTIVCRHEHDFYGWRKAWMLFTTRPVATRDLDKEAEDEEWRQYLISVGANPDDPASVEATLEKLRVADEERDARRAAASAKTVDADDFDLSAYAKTDDEDDDVLQA